MKKALLIIVGVIVAIGVIGAIIDIAGEEKDQGAGPTPAVAQTEETEPEELSLKKKIETITVELLKDKTNMDLPRIVEIKETDGVAFLTLNADENFSASWTKTGILGDTKELFEQLFKEEDLLEVNIDWQFTLIDAYGREFLDKVMTVVIGKETAAKINWENLLTDNIPVIADDYWEHPALSK